MDCHSLPSILYGAHHGVKGYSQNVGPHVPQFERKWITVVGGEFALKVLLPSLFLCSSYFFFHCMFLETTFIVVDIDLSCDSAMIYCTIFCLCIVSFHKYQIYMLRELTS